MNLKTLLKNAVVISILIITAFGCEQEHLQFQSVDCNGCNDIPPGGGTITTAPTISSFSPQYGLPGDQIAIYGNRFSATPSNNIVKFNGVQASVVYASSSLLIVSVPSGAFTGKISVTVNALQGVSATDFEVLRDIPRNGLILFYPFTGNYNDASGNGKNLIAQNSANNPTVANDRFNKSGQAYTFDGINDYLYTGNVTIDHPITFSFWTRYSSLDLGAFLGTKGNGTPNGFSIQSSTTGGSNRLVTYLDNNVRFESNSNFLPTSTNNFWIFIAVSFDGTTFRLYKNGVLNQTITGSGTITSTNMFQVGYSQNGGYYAGIIDDIAVYDRVLTDAEIVQLNEQNITSRY